MIVTGNRGLAALFTGDHEAARAAFREELEIVRELVLRPIASEGFLGLAALAAADGNAPRAARLRGAAQSHTFDNQQEDVVRRVEARFLDAARASAGADAWDRAAREGAALSFEDAIAYALEERVVDPTGRLR